MIHNKIKTSLILLDWSFNHHDDTACRLESIFLVMTLIKYMYILY